MNFNLKSNLKKVLSKYKILLIIIVILIFSIRIINSVYIFNYKYNENKIPLSMNLSIISKEKESETYVSYLTKLNYKEGYKDKFLLYIYMDKKNKENISDFINKHNKYKYGDIICVKGKIVYPNKLNNLHEFDYKLYLNSKDIVASIMTVDSIKISENKFSLIKYVNNFKENIENKIDDKIPEKEGNLFKSMVYGNDKNLDENIKKNFTKLGLSHLIAVSGSNVSIVLVIIKYILTKIKVKENKSNIISVIFVYLFCILCNFEISVIRASLMICIVLIFPFKINKYILMCVTIFIMLYLNPYVIFNISFILSFIATFGIVLFNKRIFSFFNLLLVKIFKLEY
ncbi:MAG: ComEC/Rec2 family competence protein, partial [Clostridia bacterium]